MPEQGKPDQAELEPRARLADAAATFANDLNETLKGAFGTVPPFDVQASEGDTRSRIAVSQGSATGIELSIQHVPRLRLIVEYWCVLDRADYYLAVDESKIKVYAIDGPNEPLFRYEYLRKPSSQQPCAHLQVHAHRDAVSYLMTLSGAGSPRGKRRQASVNRSGSMPRFSELHFPLGGPRFRPCLEDVLHMLLDEFGVDAPQGALERLAAAREAWRLQQLAAAVRDSPSTAARVLIQMGYAVEPPQEGPVADQIEKLRIY